MRRSSLLAAVLATLFATLLAAPTACAPAPEPPPNILLIVADDLGVGDLGSYGPTDAHTPNLDALAASGVRFTRFYTAGDVCAPTRASLLTGLYPLRLGFRGTNPGIPPEVATLPEVLRDAGYATHHIGKWHLGSEPPSRHPLRQGFDSFFGFLDPAQLGSYRNPRLVTGAGEPRVHAGHLTDLLTERAVDRIVEGARGGPWFLDLWYYAPHTPAQPPRRFAQRYPRSGRGLYLAQVAALDESVGRLMRAIEESGQAERTIVLFLSDNGAIDPRSNRPFFGAKSQFYEGGLRTPLLVRAPGAAPSVVDAVASSLDIHPTLTSLAGLAPVDDVDGIDLSPLLRGAASQIRPRELFWENVAYTAPRGRKIHPTAAVAAPPDLAPGRDFGVLDSSGRWRLAVEKQELSLFDLETDPAGRKNVITEHPEQAERMIAAYRDWSRELPAGNRNLLLVTLDTTRADFLSCLGGPDGTTPNLDALAARSALFEAATSETNATDPSHLTILSGLRAIEHRVLTNFDRVPAGITTLPQLFRRRGHRTAGFAAARHLGPQFGWRGFETLPALERTLDATEVTDRALAWLARQDTQPFFLWVHYFDPHTPYDPPPEIASRFYSGDPSRGEGPRLAERPYFEKLRYGGVGEKLAEWLGDARDPAWPRAMYAAELHQADGEIGRLLRALDTKGLANATLVVVVGDHGESLDEHGIYLGHVGLYEPQLRVPLLVHVPGLGPTRVTAPVSTLDVAPTIAELFGLDLPAGPGVSLVGALSGADTAALEGRIFVHQHSQNAAVALREGPWKLIWPIDTANPVLSHAPELYHLGQDPGELHDLAAAEPERVARMRARLEPWVGLGVVRPGRAAHLDAGAREQLRTLGYVDDTAP